MGNGEAHNVSVVIPTADRSRNLNDALESIDKQSLPIKEIIIIDSSRTKDTWNLIATKKKVFAKKGIQIDYFWEPRISISHARNTGLKKAKSEFVMSLDDDMVLSEGYLEELMKVFKKYPAAIGVQGKFQFWSAITNRIRLKMLIRRLFLVTHWWPNVQRILASGDYVLAEPLTRIIDAELIWIQASVFKKKYLDGFWFDENLKGYSYGEDVDFTMRLNKRFPHSLFVTPYAKSIHNQAPLERMLTFKKLRAHELYLFRKNMTELGWNWLAFLWRNVGVILLVLLNLRIKENRLGLFQILSSYVWCLRQFSDVINGRIP